MDFMRLFSCNARPFERLLEMLVSNSAGSVIAHSKPAENNKTSQDNACDESGEQLRANAGKSEVVGLTHFFQRIIQVGTQRQHLVELRDLEHVQNVFLDTAQCQLSTGSTGLLVHCNQFSQSRT